jgi:outer membrane cobalamin receptor
VPFRREDTPGGGFVHRPVLLFSLWLFALPTDPAMAQAPAPSSDASLAGIVLDADQRPLPGVRVALETGAGVAFHATSDDAGRFDLPILPSGDYVLRAFHPGRRADAVSLRLAPGDTREVTVRLRVSPVEETIVVSARQVEVAASAAPSAISTFTAKDIARRQLESTADLLRLASGVTVAQSGSRGGLTSVFPRGGESDYTLVLVDGVRVNAFGGGFDFASLPAGEVERLEFVRGPQSAMFGSDAIGGVVHVVTRQGGPPQASALFEGGSLDTARGVAGGAATLGRWHLGGSAERLVSDGFTGSAPGTGEPVTNDDMARTAVQGSARFTASRWNLASHARRISTEKGYPGPFGSDPNGTFGGVDRVSRGWTTDRSAGASGQFAFSPTLRFRGWGSMADLESRFRSPYGDSRFETRRANARVQVDAGFGARLGLSAGSEFLDEDASSTFILSDAGETPIARQVLGTFAEGRYEASPRFTASLGVRVEHIRRAAVPADSSPFSPRPAFEAQTTVSTNPRASFAWFARDASTGAVGWTRLRASAGTGIRPPDAYEIAFTDNPDLKPERSQSFDVGVEQGWLDGRLITDATAFWNRYDDLIVAIGRDFANASQYRTDNIANARARGLETTVSMRAWAWLDLRAGYTWLDTEVLAVDGQPGQAPAPFEPGDPLIRRPRHQGWFELLTSGLRWSAFARLTARGDVLDVDPSYGAFGGTVEAPGFAVTDIGASLAVWKPVSLTARVTNLFDRTYEEAFGFPSPGRSVIVGVRVASRP